MKRVLFAVLMLAVWVLPGNVAADPGSVSRTFFLHCEQLSDVSFEFFLDLRNDIDATSPCGGDTVVVGRVTTDFPAREGIPLRLDARRSITGAIALRGLFVDSELTVEVTGVIDGVERSLGRATSTSLDGAQADFDFSIAPRRSLHNRVITHLALVTTVEGAVQSVAFEVNEPDSFLVLPIVRH